jgi:hypothetical protein
MTIDFTAKKLERHLELIEDPFEFEVLECLYEKYVSGDVDVQFIDGEAFFSLKNHSGGDQLELPLE